MLKDRIGELNQQFVHPALSEGKQPLDEPNVTSSLRDHQDEVRVSIDFSNWKSCNKMNHGRLGLQL